MDFFKAHYPIIATSFFVLAIAVAHMSSSQAYDWTKNTISDLGAQGYAMKPIMQIGFLGFGLLMSIGLVLNGLNWRNAPILLYAVCVGMTGIFCTKPFVAAVDHSATEAMLHSVFAQLAGVAFTIGILVQLVSAERMSEKWGHLTFLVLVIGFSAAFGLVNTYQGVVQRLLYLVSFIWLIRFFKA